MKDLLMLLFLNRVYRGIVSILLIVWISSVIIHISPDGPPSAFLVAYLITACIGIIGSIVCIVIGTDNDDMSDFTYTTIRNERRKLEEAKKNEGAN